MKITSLAKDFVHLFYPDLCVACNRSLWKDEKFFCLDCSLTLPETNYHHERNNAAEKLFYGRCRIEKASAFYFFARNTRVQHLLHNIKYKGIKEAATETGKRYGEKLRATESFASADVIIPVPLHPNKQMKRGFNQSEFFAEGLSASLRIPYDIKAVQRIIETDTQTRKGRYQRWENVENIFSVSDADTFNNKNIIIVDDVITTGSTIEACIASIEKHAHPQRISVAAIAIAHK